VEEQIQTVPTKARERLNFFVNRNNCIVGIAFFKINTKFHAKKTLKGVEGLK
jgi:hypothetical protein